MGTMKAHTELKDLRGMGAKLLIFGARSRTRTGTDLSVLGILSSVVPSSTNTQAALSQCLGSISPQNTIWCPLLFLDGLGTPTGTNNVGFSTGHNVNLAE